METSKITVIGSVNMDLVTKTEKVPKPGETVLGTGFSAEPGGKGANQAVAAARLGADVTMIGSVGNDHFGKALIENFQKENIFFTNVEPVTGAASGVAQITVSNGENSIIVAPGANHTLKPEQLVAFEDQIAKSNIVLLQLEIPLSVVEKAVDLAHLHGVPIILNPAPAVRLPKQLLEKIDYLTPNEHEICQVFGDHGQSSPEQLLQDCPQKLIMTKGASGVFYYDEKLVHVPGYPIDAVDTTGAGDTFNGALAFGLCRGMSIEKACQFANAAGALSAMKLGAQSGMPTLEEVEQFMDLKRAY
ncbi:MAG TPA: ribokinase [Bacillales bacterium]